MTPGAGISSNVALRRALLLCCLPVACTTEAPVFIASYEPAISTGVLTAEVVTIPVTPLQYYRWIDAASLPELDAEYARLMERPGSADPVIRTVHLGILLGVSALATPDTEQEALALLDIVDSPITDINRDYAAFADFLRAHLRQRAELRNAQDSAAQSRAQIRQLETDSAELQRQIDALTTLEQQLIEREQAQEP